MKIQSLLSHLKDHPFAVEAFFDSSLVLTYAIPKEDLEPLLPDCLRLDLFNEKWGFVAIAVVKTKNLRPKGFPKILGRDFILTGYRIFVRYTTSEGKRLRGLYILKSQTDKKGMAFWGNLFTHYKYTTTDISLKNTDKAIQVRSLKSNVSIEVNWEKEIINLPRSSPFNDWKEARRFAGPLPFTFTYDEKKKEVLIIEGVRENWTPKPVEVSNENVGFLKELGFANMTLANAFLIEKVPYYWKKGRKDLWKQ